MSKDLVTMTIEIDIETAVNLPYGIDGMKHNRFPKDMY